MRLFLKKLMAPLFLASMASVVGAQSTSDVEGERSPDLSAGVEIDIQSGESIRIQRFDHKQVDITIDGHLDEAVWASLPVFDQFKVIEPDTLAVPKYRTEFRILYTENGIYASFDFEQPQETIVRRFFVRDDFDVSRDNAGFTLDTSGDGRYGFFVNLSVGDVQMDGTLLPERQYSRDWDGAWYGATQLTDQGWSAEYFLPWSQVAMPKQEGVRRIGLFATRVVAHLDQRWALPALPDTQPRFISSFQPLELSGVDPKQQWSIFPYGSATYDRVDDETRYKAGLDVFWRPSSNFQLTATANPDFGAVEADDVIINLTADETFFPEKRLFFVEGQEIFSTTPRSESEFGQKFALVNTRRIGASPREPQLPPGVSLPTREEVRPSDLLGAAKTTGQIGSFRYGVLAASEDESDFLADDGLLYFQDGRGFGAVRVLYEDDRGAAYRGFGFISTLVAHPEADAVVHGIDFHRLSTSGVWNVEGQLVYSDLDAVGSGTGGFLDVDYRPRQGRTHSVQLTVFDDTIDVNDFGFQVRNDTRDVRYSGEWVNSDISWGRDLFANMFLRYVENGAGLRTRGSLGGGFNLTFDNLQSVSMHGGYNTDHYDDRNSFGNGTFKVDAGANANIEFETNESKPLSLFARLEYRDEALGGYSLEGIAGIDWRPVHNIKFHFDVAYKDRDGWLLHQEDSNFTTFNSHEWRPNFSVDYFPTAKQQFQVALQWVGIRAREDEFYTLPDDSMLLVPGPKPPGPTDNFNISDMSFQFRYRWQIAPLSDLFIVYTRVDSRDTSITEFSDMFSESWNMPLGDFIIIKLRYRLGS
jgi:hypothetical protein